MAIESLQNTVLGEITEASSAEFTVDCHELYASPPLGGFVKTEDGEEVFAVVRSISTAPIDPTRRPVARGKNEPDRDAVYRKNPQLEKLLRTEFLATIVGHRANGGYHQYLPPQPPKIHTFIHACSTEEILSFTQKIEFLPLLLFGPMPLGDEVTAAFLRASATSHPDPSSFLLASGREISRLLNRDFQRLNALLRRIRP